MTCKITIPAVKIVTGSAASAPPSLPNLPDESMLNPDPCPSTTTPGTPAVSSGPSYKLERIDSALFPRPEVLAAIPMPATTLMDVEENEAEFGEFLLDAVDWL